MTTKAIAKHEADHLRRHGTRPDRRCRMVRSTDCWCEPRPEREGK